MHIFKKFVLKNVEKKKFSKKMLKTQTSKEHPFTLNNEEEAKFSLYLEEICQLPQF